jgi:hypothetical protein
MFNAFEGIFVTNSTQATAFIGILSFNAYDDIFVGRSMQVTKFSGPSTTFSIN